MNNGLSTGYFKLSRGTKQGDPLSTYLFILVLEILFIQVRNDPSVQGFKIGILKLSYLHLQMMQHFFVRNKESINRLLNVIRKFGEFSLLHANVELYYRFGSFLATLRIGHYLSECNKNGDHKRTS